MAHVKYVIPMVYANNVRMEILTFVLNAKMDIF